MISDIFFVLEKKTGLAYCQKTKSPKILSLPLSEFFHVKSSLLSTILLLNIILYFSLFWSNKILSSLVLTSSLLLSSTYTTHYFGLKISIPRLKREKKIEYILLPWSNHRQRFQMQLVILNNILFLNFLKTFLNKNGELKSRVRDEEIQDTFNVSFCCPS